MKPRARNAAKGEEAITGSFPGSQTRPPTYPPFPSTCVLQLDRSPAATLPLTTSIFVMAWYEAIATRPPQRQTRQLSGAPLYQSDSQSCCPPFFSCYCLTAAPFPASLSCCPTMAPLPTFLKPRQDTNSLYTAIVLPSQQSGGLPLAFARCSNGLIPAPAYVTSLLLPATQHRSEEPGDETQDVPHHLHRGVKVQRRVASRCTLRSLAW